MNKKITINGKTYVEEEGAPVVPPTEVPVETPEVTPPAVEPTPTVVSEEVIDETAQKILKSLGIDELKNSINELKAATNKDSAHDAKMASLIDLAGLMKKDVSQLTANEKIIGFFQAIVQNNHVAMKALSEG